MLPGSVVVCLEDYTATELLDTQNSQTVLSTSEFLESFDTCQISFGFSGDTLNPDASPRIVVHPESEENILYTFKLGRDSDEITEIGSYECHFCGTRTGHTFLNQGHYTRFPESETLPTTLEQIPAVTQSSEKYKVNLGESGHMCLDCRETVSELQEILFDQHSHEIVSWKV